MEQTDFIPLRMQQVHLKLQDGRTLVYVGEPQVELGETITVVDLEFTQPVEVGTESQVEQVEWADSEEE